VSRPGKLLCYEAHRHAKGAAAFDKKNLISSSLLLASRKPGTDGRLRAGLRKTQHAQVLVSKGETSRSSPVRVERRDRASIRGGLKA